MCASRSWSLEKSCKLDNICKSFRIGFLTLRVFSTKQITVIWGARSLRLSPATWTRASTGQDMNQSTEVPQSNAGKLLRRRWNCVPTGLRHNKMCRFLRNRWLKKEFKLIKSSGWSAIKVHVVNVVNAPTRAGASAYKVRKVFKRTNLVARTP